jgi:hypothetical protein
MFIAYFVQDNKPKPPQTPTNPHSAVQCSAVQCTQEEALLKVDIRLKAVLTLI